MQCTNRSYLLFFFFKSSACKCTKVCVHLCVCVFLCVHVWYIRVCAYVWGDVIVHVWEPEFNVDFPSLELFDLLLLHNQSFHKPGNLLF